jgi:hypothetical protein
MSPFACLSPVKDHQYFLCFIFVHSLIAFLATPIEMPQAGSGPMNGCHQSRILVEASPRSFSFRPMFGEVIVSRTERTDVEREIEAFL